MADLAYPFDDAPVYQAQWETMARLWAPDGLDARNPAVTLGAGLTFNIPANVGGVVRGFRYWNDAAQTKTEAVTNPSATGQRIDRLVLRLDRSTKSIVPAIKRGTSSTTPVPPALTQNSTVWEIPWYRATCPVNGQPQNYTALGAEWRAISSERGKHIWIGSVAANSSGPTVPFSSASTSQYLSDGIASIVSGDLVLNIPGIWSLSATCDTDAGLAGLSTLSMQWDGGEFRDDFKADSRPRASGYAGAGRLRQSVEWTGIVRPAAALRPISVACAWFPSSGSAAVTYPVRLYADYLGG